MTCRCDDRVVSFLKRIVTAETIFQSETHCCFLCLLKPHQHSLKSDAIRNTMVDRKYLEEFIKQLYDV